MNNLSSYCGLVDAKIRAFDKDLPVFLPSDNYQLLIVVGSFLLNQSLNR